MKTYLVGGAVRDLYLNITPKDWDYVVVGETPTTMLNNGYKQVGRDFPVFLHPTTGDEYALARTEEKVGVGYNSFETNWQGISLEEDLHRRDLTINSMALDSDNNIIDPYNGLDDLCNHILRHTSEAFVEDPVRVLRVARFLARYGEGWEVTPETYALCQKIAWSEFKSLTKERVFQEMDKALSEPYPWLFFEFLYMLDFDWFTEVWSLKGIPQPIKHHPENDTFLHTMLCLKSGVELGASKSELFAILCHDFGKPPCWNKRRNLHGHENEGLVHVTTFCDRLGVPLKYRMLALKVCKQHQRCHKILDMNANKIHNLLVELDCFRKPDTLNSFLLCNTADARGRTGFEYRVYKQATFLMGCYGACLLVDSFSISQECLNKGQIGSQIGDRIRQAQISAIKKYQREYKNG